MPKYPTFRPVQLEVSPALPVTALPVPTAGCPTCRFPIRRACAGELICPNCGHRETLARAFWEAVGAECVRGGGVRVCQ